MTRILTLIALLFATSAWAQKPYKGGDWVFIMEDSLASYYIDRDSIKIDGDLISFVSVQNAKKPDGFGPDTYLISEQINCIEGKQRTLSLTEWSKHYGRGKLITGDTATKKWMVWGNAKMMQHPFYGKLCR